MTKITGKNAYLIVDDSTGASQVVSPYLNSIVLKTKGDMADVTAFGSNTREQLPTLKDWSLDFTGFYSEAEIDAVFAGILGGSTVIQFGPAGSDSGNVRYSASGVLTSYKRDIVLGEAVGVGGTIVARSGSLTRDTWPAPNWWVVAGHTCLAAYRAKGAASYATSLVNLANPGTYDLTEGVAPDWDTTNGWKANGTQYLKTGIVPSAWLGVGTMLIQYTNFVPGASWIELMGQEGSGDGSKTDLGWGSTGMWATNGCADIQNAPLLTAGNYGVAGRTPYRNGVAEPNIGSGTATSTTQDIYIMACGYGGAPYNRPAGLYVQAVWISNETLNASEMASLAAVMAAL